MQEQSKKIKNFWILIPVFGCLSFVILYFIGTLLYPGGSHVDKNAEGFSWMNNYWCNLLNKYAINGQQNPARPVAYIGMIILCTTLSFFWYIFPIRLKSGKYGKIVIQFSGSMSMTIVMFISPELHDTIINAAGIFAIIAIVGSFVGLYKRKWFGMFWLGLFNLFLLILNDYAFHSIDFVVYSPIIQKISFATFLSWVCLIEMNLILENRQITSININKNIT